MGLLFAGSGFGAGISCTTEAVNTTSIGFAPDGGSSLNPGRPGVIRPPGTGGSGAPEPVSCPTSAPETPKPAGDACDCDIECSTGNCVGKVCCAGAACGTRRPLGAACESNDECLSETCADGVCCNVACTGACVACNLPERAGECAPVPAGSEDPHQVCRRDPPDTCGQSGICNGQGGCAKYSAGTICRQSSCDGPDEFVPASMCDGEGACIAGVGLSCKPSTCESGICLSSCTGNDQCMSPATCVEGSCGPKGLGQDCSRNEQCQSQACVDGVCCESACTGTCLFCARPDARGRCLPVKEGILDQRAARGLTAPGGICEDQGPESCGTNGRCDGDGGCQSYGDGTVCWDAECDPADNTETSAGTCRGGQCRTPAPRSCAPFRGCSGSSCRSGCGSDSQCSAGNVCTGGDCGKRPDGALCSRAGECASNFCAQGRCCNSACGGTCQSCALRGSEGICSNVPVGGADPSGTCRDDECSNGCDGAGDCRRERPGTSCGGSGCTGNTISRRVCNDSGSCETRGSSCPGGQVCMGDRCAPPEKNDPGEPCVADGDCKSSSCVDGRCCSGDCDGECRECRAPGFSCTNRAGSSCGAGGRCGGGICCPGNRTNCDGQCRNLQNDGANCGGCGVRCAGGQICRAGACEISCNKPLEICGNSCVDTSTNVAHCGGCDERCSNGSVCDGGSCRCPANRPQRCGTSCCRQGSECDGDTCLPPRPDPMPPPGCNGRTPQRCGATCCAAGDRCVNDFCVPPPQPPAEACGGRCRAPQLCVRDQCVCPQGPRPRACGTSCCAADDRCDGNTCLPPRPDPPPPMCNGRTPQRCGATCCAAGDRCVNDFCVPPPQPPPQACGGRCRPPQRCVRDQCVCPEGPTPRACGTSCCAADDRCDGNTCLPPRPDPPPPMCNGRTPQRCGATCCAADDRCVNDFCVPPPQPPPEACGGRCRAPQRCVRDQCVCPQPQVTCGTACCPPGSECGNNSCRARPAPIPEPQPPPPPTPIPIPTPAPRPDPGTRPPPAPPSGACSPSCQLPQRCVRDQCRCPQPLVTCGTSCLPQGTQCDRT